MWHWDNSSFSSERQMFVTARKNNCVLSCWFFDRGRVCSQWGIENLSLWGVNRAGLGYSFGWWVERGFCSGSAVLVDLFHPVFLQSRFSLVSSLHSYLHFWAPAPSSWKLTMVYMFLARRYRWLSYTLLVNLRSTLMALFPKSFLVIPFISYSKTPSIITDAYT